MNIFLRKNFSILRKAGLFSFLLFLTLIFSGCSLKDTLENFDKKIGETFNNFQEDQKNSIMELMKEKKADEKNEKTISDLSMDEKKKIDEWLEEKNLNRYGDSKNAIYTGGTPLFDEKTGKAVDRYDYLLNKFPNLLEIIK